MIHSEEIIIDLFAGGGGASEGIRMALGRDPDVAVNHDPVAIAMHTANHPSTWHLRQDVWEVPPRWATKGRPVGLLWASPDCTHHSKAKGGPPIRDEKKRDLAWVVEKWAQAVRPRVIMLENVEEFRDWGPLDKIGHIIKSQKGCTFTAFVRSLRRLGYRVQWKELVACDYGAPTSRKRFFMVARCDGLPIVWPEPTHGQGTANPWRSAAEIIDWSISCPSIFSRKKPLAENTLRRIANGIRKYVMECPNPFLLTYYGMKNEREPLPTVVPTANGAHLVSAFLAKHYTGVVGQQLEPPIGTITSVDHHSLVACNLIRHFGKSTGQSPEDPVGTIMPGGSGKTGLLTSYLVKYKGTSRDGQSLSDPLHTVQCSPHYAQVTAFMIKYYGTGGSQACTDPTATITAKDRLALVTVTIAGEPYVIADIGMRMLSPRELFLAQGFPGSYQIDIEVDGKPISKSNQVRMCGNSVCPQVAAALVSANLTATGDSTRVDLGQKLLQLNMFVGSGAQSQRLGSGLDIGQLVSVPCQDQTPLMCEPVRFRAGR